MTTHDLPTLHAALRSQWTRLHQWLVDLDDADGLDVDEPSALPGWTVGELVSHVGRALDALHAVTLAPPGTHPLALAEYLGTYPERAGEIDTATRELDTRLAPDRLAGVDALALGALARLDELEAQAAPGTAGDLVVQARRGPIRLRDMVVSRLVELVVHGDDLVRSLPGSTFGATASDGPVDPAILRIVADELLDVVATREGCRLEVVDPVRWVRLAAGRSPYDVDELALALAAPDLADAVPDLGRSLPVL